MAKSSSPVGCASSSTQPKAAFPSGTEHENQGIRNNLPVEEDECRAPDYLFDDSGLGVRGDLQNVQVEVRLPAASNFDQAIRKSTWLNELGLKGPPRFDVIHARQAKDRIAVMLNQPLAALVVFVHRFSAFGL